MNFLQILQAQEDRGYASDTREARKGLTNSVARRIYTMRRWPWLKNLNASGGNTVAGTEAYDVRANLPTLQFIEAIALATTGDLEYLEPEQYREYARWNRSGDRGTPQVWTSTDEIVYFYPIPESAEAIKVDYIALPSDLSADSDTPAIPTAYHDLLVWGPLVEMCYRERDYDGATMAVSHFDPRLMEMMHQYGMVQRQTSTRVVQSGQFVDPEVDFPWGL